MSSAHEYVGTELELFAEAIHWKSYLRSQIAPFLRGRVLEVGAGIGGTTRLLWNSDVVQWTCLEPDPALAARIQPGLGELFRGKGDALEVIVGTTRDLPPKPDYDLILYIDVLEHIEDDGGELLIASHLLRENGHLIVLAPAHQWLFSPFDRAIGHFRRYTRSALKLLTPPGLKLCRLRYLDSVGLIASSGNRCLLRSAMPTQRQLALWDRVMVPLSRCLDPLFGYRLGKSVYAVWRRAGGADHE